MLRNLLATERDHTALFLRLVLGLAIFPHGAQKLLGWWGGYGLDGTMAYLTSLGIPAVFGLLAIVAEFFGSIGLIVGLLGRVAAFGIACVMLMATLTVHLPNGFFQNWFGNQAGEGSECFVLAIALAAVVIVKGSGSQTSTRACPWTGSSLTALQSGVLWVAGSGSLRTGPCLGDPRRAAVAVGPLGAGLGGRPREGRAVPDPDRPPRRWRVGPLRVDQRPTLGRPHLPVGQRSAGAGPAATEHRPQTQVHQVGRAGRYQRCLQQLEQGGLPTTQGPVHRSPTSPIKCAGAV